jgi:site-specific DNA recombinase
MTTRKEGPIKAAGYVRVSSKEQTEGESLSTQRESIRNFMKGQGWRLTDIYADEGISGGSVKERSALLKCMRDGQDGKFDVLVIHRLSRFGRNARELLINHDELRNVGVELRSISEGIDFGNKYGKAMLGMFAVMAELERDIIRETMLENRIARGRKGIPTVGKLPFARTFNRDTGQWELDEEKAKLLRWAADEYLKGESLRDISETLRTRYKLPLGYHFLITVLSKRCGDTWTVNFKGEEPIIYQIPRILDDDTIQRIRQRLEHNRIECRKDVRKYAMTGFIRCEACGKSLAGQTQVNRYGTHFPYYRHPGGKYEPCKAMNSVPLKLIEKAIFKTIFENTVDVPAFEEAIKESLPDEKLIKSLERRVRAGEKELKRLDRELDKLVEAVLTGTLKKGTVRNKEKSLYEAKATVTEELEGQRERLRSMPSIERVKRESEAIRLQLLEHFGSEDRLQEMSFDEKKTLLHWLFDGKDSHGTPYGIYLSKRGNGVYDYFLYGRITGLRTVKGEDINYQGWDEYEEIYKTNSHAKNHGSYLPVGKGDSRCAGSCPPACSAGGFSGIRAG